MTLRRCTKCLDEHPVVFFNKDRSREDGTYPQCKNCTRNNCRRVYQQDHTQRLEKNRAWKVANDVRHREINREWQLNNPDMVRANAARYRARLKQATPQWADKELIQFIHSQRPKGWHVDHTHPLVGENFCGLNVPWNLQYLPAAVHHLKGCKPPVEAGGHSHL